MNERIKELATLAGYNKIFDNDTKARARLEKFAKLIIAECARISNEADDTMTNQGAASAEAFKEHFGVIS